MGVYEMLDEQTWSPIFFLLAVIAMILYFIVTFFMIVSHIFGRFVLYKKEDPTILLTDNLPGVSIIKPLMGMDAQMEANLESHFLLNYPKYELLCCVQDDQDPAITTVHKFMERYPKVDCKLFIGGTEGIINPMVHNMAPAYNNCDHDYVWISTSRIKANSDIILDMVCKLQRPNVGVCHQMPFVTDQKGFAQKMEKTYFGGAFARYYISFNAVGLCCCTGMSYMIKKHLLDEVKGLDYYGRYLAEDFYLTQALHEKGHRLVLSSYPAEQSLAPTTICSYKDRMVRWLRLRLNMMPIVSGVVEPLSECIPLGLYASWSFYHFFGFNPYIFFTVHICCFIVSDYIQLRLIQNGPLAFSKCEYVVTWFVRELVVICIFFEAIISPRTIKWGKRTYRLSLGGHTEIVNDKSNCS